MTFAVTPRGEALPPSRRLQRARLPRAASTGAHAERLSRGVDEEASGEDHPTERDETQDDGHRRDVRRRGREQLGDPRSPVIPRHGATVPPVPQGVHPKRYLCR
jgi:hypothetical protein